MNENTIRQAIEAIETADRIVILTGAGVSAESGIQTFRDAQSGMWANFDPMKLASQDGFAQDAGLVWRWYMERLKKLGEVQPNPAHLAIARLQKQKRDVTLITQNVDDLHERAGSQAVLHLHGTIARFHCNECGTAHLISAVEMDADLPPVCDLCLGKIRPSVVWFGEMLPQHELQQAWQAVRACDLMIVIGTSGVVYPVAELPFAGQRAGATILDVNPVATPISEMANISLRGNAGEVLPLLVPQ